MEGNLVQETRNRLIYMVSVTHQIYHKKEPEAWRECRNQVCRETAQFLDNTDSPETAAHDRITELYAASIYGARLKRGLVEIKVGGAVAMVRPSEGRAFALSVLEACEAAESDEFLMNWLAETVGLKGDGAKAALLQEARKHRLRLRRRDEGEEEDANG